MGNNSLQTTEKNLRSIAKRYENVKYSVGLAVLFLMKGTSAFSDDNMIQETEKQKDILIDVKKEKSQLKEKKTITQKTQKERFTAILEPYKAILEPTLSPIFQVF